MQTQELIANGLLQQILNELDPQSSFVVVNASFPVRTTLPPTTAPFTTPMPSIQPASIAPVTSSIPSTEHSSSAPTIVPSVTMSKSPVLTPTEGGDENEEEGIAGGSSSGAVVGALIGSLAFVGAAVYAYRRFGIPYIRTLFNQKKPLSGDDIMGSDREGGSDEGQEVDNTFDLAKFVVRIRLGISTRIPLGFGDTGGFTGNAFGDGDAFGLET